MFPVLLLNQKISLDNPKLLIGNCEIELELISLKEMVTFQRTLSYYLYTSLKYCIYFVLQDYHRNVSCDCAI